VARTRAPELCPRCWRPSRSIRFEPADYAELLGLYLGDGCISDGPRTKRLRIALDAKYPVIIEEARQLLERCFTGNGVGVQQVPTYNHVYLSAYSKHLPCLFPQHGPGKKHERRIVLEEWQKELVDKAPWAFLRGCVRSDGCVFINGTDVHRPQPYEYLSYEFSNLSEDIARLFVETSETLGLLPRINCDRRGRWAVRINRRASVALMLEHVGLKT
jgi:hypothetical protein